MVGGVAALIGAKFLGPRIGKYGKNGEAKAIPGHSLTLGALGVFILWFCWFGFNGASTVSMEGSAAETAAKIFVTTNLAAAVSTCVVMAITWIRYRKPDVSMTLNGTLAGLVAITAGCDTVSPVSAAIIGALAGFVVVFGIEFIDQKLKIDDPVGAVGVHGLNGLLGTICVGLFSDGSGTNGLGLFMGGGVSLLGVQLLGAVAIIAWVAVTMTIVFAVIKKTIGLRVSREEELAGLDIMEHGLENSYAGFLTQDDAVPGQSVPAAVQTSAKADGAGHPLTKISIVTRRNKLEELTKALHEIGVTGMTISEVLGCGVQKGDVEYYRGVKMDVKLLPKVKIEIVVSEIPVDLVVKTARRVLYTGQYGDGKIFVYEVENAVKIRTGEDGIAALQDVSKEA